MHNVEGRYEKRIPLEIPISLTLRENVAAVEKAATVNISSHGARLITTRLWQPGQEPQIIPSSGKFQAQAKVVYCQIISEERFYIGIKFRAEFAKQWVEFLIEKLLQNVSTFGVHG
jgi:hypothetical protein